MICCISPSILVNFSSLKKGKVCEQCPSYNHIFLLDINRSKSTFEWRRVLNYNGRETLLEGEQTVTQDQDAEERKCLQVRFVANS